MRPALLAISSIALVAGCGAPAAKDHTGAATTDTGAPSTTPETEYEEGCIVVDGGDGYAYLQDAITVASDGSTIALCGDLNESVVLSGKAVTILGDGVDSTIWSAPTNELPITVEAGGSAQIRDLSLSSTRSGALANGGYLELSNVEIPASGGYGIEAIEGTVVASNIHITDPPWGGIRMSGGALSLTDSSITGATTAAVLGENGAELELIDNTILRTDFVDDGSGTVADGFGVWVTGESSLTTDGNLIEDSILAAYFIENSGATLGADSIVSSTPGSQFLGLYIDNSTVTGAGLSISEMYQWSVYSYSSEVTLSGAEIHTTPESSLQSTVGADGSTTTGSMGVVVVDGSFDLSNSTITGHNSAGAWIESTAGDATLLLSEVTLDGNGERGLYAYESEVYAIDTQISNTFNNDEVCIASDGSMSCNMAMFNIGSTTEFVGGSVHDNESWGLAALEGDLRVDGMTFDNNEFVGIFAQASNATVQNSSLTGWGNFGMYFNDATGLVSDTLFSDRSYTVYNTSIGWDGADGWVDYYYQAIDVYSYSSDLIVQDVRVENSDYGLYIYESSVQIDDLELEDVNSPTYISTSSSVEIDGLSATGTGSTVLDCYDASLDASSVEILDSVPTQYAYDYYYGDGTLAFTSTGEGSYAAIDAYLCDISLEDVDLSGIEAEGAYLYDSSTEIDDLSIVDAGRYSSTDAAIQIYNYTKTPEIELREVEITGQLNGHGIEIEDGAPDKSPGFVSITNARLGHEVDGISGIARSGLWSSEVDLTIDGLECSNTGEVALTIDEASEVQIVGNNGTLSGQIDNIAAGHGIMVQNTGSSALQALTIDGAPSSGVFIDDSSLSLTDVTITAAAEYGIDCGGSVALPSCDGSFSGLLGEFGPECPVCTP